MGQRERWAEQNVRYWWMGLVGSIAVLFLWGIANDSVLGAIGIALWPMTAFGSGYWYAEHCRRNGRHPWWDRLRRD